MNDEKDRDLRDTARDAWLSEALRHAPDAQAAPPSTLRDSILRQARAAARPAAGPAKAQARSPWAAAWDWIARPPVAAGFASLMVATLVGLMWWDQPIDPMLQRPPAPDASPAAAPPAPASVVGAMPESAAKVEPEAPAARESFERKRAASAPSKSTALTPKPAAKRADENVARQGARREPTPFKDDAAEAGAAAAAAAAAVTATAPAPSTASAPAPAPAPAPATAAPQAATRLREDPAPPSTTGTGAAATRDESRTSLASALDRSATSTRPPALVALLASVASEPERWGWQRGEAIRPMNPALQGWLTRLDAATRSRWSQPGPVASGGDGSVLRLYRDGTLAAALRLDDEGVSLTPASRAVLPAAALAELKQGLDDATR